MAVRTLAGKDLRLLARDPRAVIILLLMPLVFIGVMGLALGEGFGQKPDTRLRVSVVVEDEGLRPGEGPFAGRAWSELVLRDLEGPADATEGVRLEVVPTRAEAERLVRRGERAAVLIFRPDFSRRVQRCSFLGPVADNPDPINPFFRDGISLDEVGVDLLSDPSQPVGRAVIEQVAQVSLLRVVMPWMIGRAFDKISDKEFIDKLGRKVGITVFGRKVALGDLLATDAQKTEVGKGVQGALKELFARYDLQGKTWAELTRNPERPDTAPTAPTPTRRGEQYKTLVPANTVMFTFFLVLTLGWLFVTERRQGTLIRLRAAPVGRWQIVVGKLLPCLAVSVAQGFVLLAAGRLIFGMPLGPRPEWLVPVVLCTSLAATGLAVLVGGVARTETQVAVYGTLLVLVLAGVSGCLLPRELMPEDVRMWTLVTPHAWSLDAYNQLLLQPDPSVDVVARSCLALVGFGTGFLVLAWLLMRLD